MFSVCSPPAEYAAAGTPRAVSRRRTFLFGKGNSATAFLNLQYFTCFLFVSILHLSNVLNACTEKMKRKINDFSDFRVLKKKFH